MNIIDMRPFTADGRPYVAYVVDDPDATPGDAECYSPEALAAYDHGEWHYVGLIVMDDTERQASVWSVEYGYAPGWSVDMDTLMVDDHYIPALVQEIQEMKS